MTPIAISGYQFLLLNTLNKYINSLPYGEQQFSTEQQGLQFYAMNASTIVENGSAFAKKIKDRSFWKTFEYSKKDLNELTKPIQDHIVAYEQTKDNCKVAIITIKRK